jgi:flavin reductase (DIM6/NTAB) family NADH-FMN oxidoreductase RutF
MEWKGAAHPAVHEAPRVTAHPAIDPTASTVSAAEFRQAMSHVTAAVHLITTGAGEHRAGLTASAVTSVSDTPAMMLACIHATSNTLAQIEANGVFCVNTLSEADRAVAEVFAGRKGLEGEARFGVGLWRPLVTGAPALASAINSFDCRLTDVRTMATHRIIIGEVLAIASKQDGAGLIYRNRRFGAF